MSRLHAKLPTYRHHKSSGQAIVSLGGRDFYLGQHGTPASKAEYDRLVAEWLARGRQAPVTSGPVVFTIDDLILAYWRFAELHYSEDGKPTRELVNIRHSLRQLRRLYGTTDATLFGPVALRAVRAAMIEANIARTTINARVGKLRRMFKWGVETELLPGDAFHRLAALSPLRRGRDGVREAKPIKAVSEPDVLAVLPHVRPPVAAMIQLQLLTGMRPGEVLTMTTGEVDRTNTTWVYQPVKHKTANAGRTRIIYLGPQAQEVLRPWLKADPTAPLFSPAEDDLVRRSERRAARRSPMTPSQKARKAKVKRARMPRAM